MTAGLRFIGAKGDSSVLEKPGPFSKRYWIDQRILFIEPMPTRANQLLGARMWNKHT